MRLGIFFSSYFWGVLLILLGVSAVLKSFNINIPLFRTFIALVFIYIGFALLFGQSILVDIDENLTIFSESNYSLSVPEDREINVLFGSSIIDLTNLEIEDDEINIEVNNIFASTEIQLSRNLPLRINASSVFGSASFPDGSKISFGEHKYNSVDDDIEHIYLDINTVFASVDVVFID
ncbi:LiaF domain-containing protein [Natronospora cellulosivora (SeqCode)]